MTFRRRVSLGACLSVAAFTVAFVASRSSTAVAAPPNYVSVYQYVVMGNPNCKADWVTNAGHGTDRREEEAAGAAAAVNGYFFAGIASASKAADLEKCYNAP